MATKKDNQSVKRESVKNAQVDNNVLEGVKFTRNETRAAIDSLNNEIYSLSGACRAFKLFANEKALTLCEYKEKRITAAQARAIMYVTTNYNILQIAAECALKVGTTFAREITIKLQHFKSPEKSFDKTDEIKPLAGIMLKEYGFNKPIKRDDCAKIGYIVNSNTTATQSKESVYIEREKFAPADILKSIIEFINAGTPKLIDRNKAKREKVAATKKAQAAQNDEKNAGK